MICLCLVLTCFMFLTSVTLFLCLLHACWGLCLVCLIGELMFWFYTYCRYMNMTFHDIPSTQRCYFVEGVYKRPYHSCSIINHPCSTIYHLHNLLLTILHCLPLHIIHAPLSTTYISSMIHCLPLSLM